MAGPLSPDFLRISSPRELQEAADLQTAVNLQQQQQSYPQQPNIPYMVINVIKSLQYI